MSSANSLSVLKGWRIYAAAAIVQLKALAPYALIELVLPGGSVMALLLWLYRRRKHGVGFGQLPARLCSFFRLDEPLPFSTVAPVYCQLRAGDRLDRVGD
jgi:hypothetical protein